MEILDWIVGIVIENNAIVVDLGCFNRLFEFVFIGFKRTDILI